MVMPAIPNLDSGKNAVDRTNTELEKAWVAYNRQDYLTARLVWESLAYQRDIIAQYNLGFLYREGLGVHQDYVLAAHWYHKAEGETDGKVDLGNGPESLSLSWSERNPLPPPSVEIIKRRLQLLKIPDEEAEDAVATWEGRWVGQQPHPRNELLIRSIRLWWRWLYESGNASTGPNEASANNVQLGLKRLGIPPDRWWESVNNMEQAAREEGREDALKAIVAWRLRQQLS